MHNTSLSLNNYLEMVVRNLYTITDGSAGVERTALRRCHGFNNKVTHVSITSLVSLVVLKMIAESISMQEHTHCRNECAVPCIAEPFTALIGHYYQ